ncbi:replication factor A protein 1-like [Cicer arietinum]|uniref:replication factor A protein 1-like n=1 Tax=Cicer arietinum TaxID=3827 RepID=UPI003CC5A145
MASIVTHKMDYTFLEQLNDQRDNWSIRVRIVRMCIVYTTQSENEPISLDIILLDEKKTPLHATIKKELLPTFKNMIQEGDIYNIINLKISPANDSYRPVVGTKKALFLTTTMVNKIQDPQFTIQKHYFNFTSFKSLPQRLGDKVNLTDIIGTLHVVGHEEQVYVGDKPTKILRLEIKMHGGETIKVTLWRNIVADFQNLFVHHKLHDGPKVVAITSTTVKKFRDDYSINSTSTTRVYINLDIPEFNILSQSDSSQSQEDEVREIPPQDFSHNTPEKRMVRNQTTLKHIMAMKWESNVQITGIEAESSGSRGYSSVVMLFKSEVLITVKIIRFVLCFVILTEDIVLIGYVDASLAANVIH